MRFGARNHLAGVLVLAGLLAACDDDSPSGLRSEAAAPFAYRVTPQAQTAVVVHAVSGSVSIVGTAPGSDLHIEGIRRVRASSRNEAQRRLEDLWIEIIETQGAITIVTRQPSSSDGLSYEVEYHIWMPDDLDLDVDQVTGRVSVRSNRADVGVRNVTGDVTLEDVQGSVDARLTTGSLTASLTVDADDVVDLAVVTGTLALSIPRSTSAVLRASVVTGNLSFFGLDVTDVDPRENVVECTLGRGEAWIEASLVTGTVHVAGR